MGLGGGGWPGAFCVEHYLAPLLIDEADYGVGAYLRALECGYRGVSTKNCKGVFRSLLNRGLVAEDPQQRFQSAEDLTNLGAIALQQDLATVLALGLPHVERNGHQYFRGLDHLPAAEVRSALEAHPDLYERTRDGARLKITAGNLNLETLDRPGYAHRVDVFPEERQALEPWLEALR